MTGQELQALRAKHGLTQAGLAGILEVTITTISRWENGHRKIESLRAAGIRARLAEYARAKKIACRKRKRVI